MWKSRISKTSEIFFLRNNILSTCLTYSNNNYYLKRQIDNSFINKNNYNNILIGSIILCSSYPMCSMFYYPNPIFGFTTILGLYGIIDCSTFNVLNVNYITNKQAYEDYIYLYNKTNMLLEYPLLYNDFTPENFDESLNNIKKLKIKIDNKYGQLDNKHTETLIHSIFNEYDTYIWENKFNKVKQ